MSNNNHPYGGFYLRIDVVGSELYQTYANQALREIRSIAQVKAVVHECRKGTGNVDLRLLIRIESSHCDRDGTKQAILDVLRPYHRATFEDLEMIGPSIKFVERPDFTINGLPVKGFA